tara:strand:- start:1193 stop:1402 length:210 start_codon:yes stop_codon:yes gene_type:complete
MPNIWLCNNAARFEETDVDSTTVGELREELGLPTEAINVDRVVAADDHQISDGVHVAAVKTNKKGGKKA